jgi:F0F1-type ATP synthase gamma subunit
VEKEEEPRITQIARIIQIRKKKEEEEEEEEETAENERTTNLLESLLHPRYLNYPCYPRFFSVSGLSLVSRRRRNASPG